MFDLLWGLISENSLCILELIIADIFRLGFINPFCEWIIDYLCTIVYCSSLGYALPRIIMYVNTHSLFSLGFADAKYTPRAIIARAMINCMDGISRKIRRDRPDAINGDTA